MTSPCSASRPSRAPPAGGSTINYTDAGRSTRSVYDAQGNVTYESDPGNTNAPGSGVPCTASTYDDAGNLTSEKQPDGAKTTYAYDGQTNETTTEGEATAASDFLPWEASSEFDAAGQAVSQTDAEQSHAGLTTTTTLDFLGRVTAATAVRDGVSEQATTTTYNHLGWVLQSVDANGVTTSATYDAHGAVLSETIGTKTTTMTYDSASGRLLTRTDADGTLVTYTYDAFGRVKRELHQSGSTTLKDIGGTNGVFYDSLGRPTSQTEVVSAVTRTWTYPQNAATGTQETLAYGASPNTSLALARNGREMETTRTATIKSGTTVTLTVADSTVGRDAADRWKQRTITQSGRAARTQNRSFDAAGRLLTQSGLGFSAAGSYSYDANSGQKSAESLPLALGGTIGNLTSEEATYTYYPGGALATARPNGVKGSFSFDEVGNLVRDAEDGAGETRFFYDAANRLTQSTLDPGDGGALTTTFYGWDAAHAWRTCQGPNPDPTPANEPVDFTYNAQGRLATCANTDTATTATYTYDGAGQRTKSVVSLAGVTTTTTYAYDELTLMSLSATQGATSWRIDYLCDEEDVPWGGVYRSPAGSTSPTYFTLVTSDRGDVVALCDSDGDAFAAYRYDAWGLPQGSGNYAAGIWTDDTSLISTALAGQIASRQVLRYAGYVYDSESGLYYCSARFYDPATRQWTTGDPAKADGEASAYQYCGGDVVSQSDPSGLAPRYRRPGHLQFRLIHSAKSDGNLKPNSPYYVRNHYYGRLTAMWRLYGSTGGVTYKKRRFPAVSGNNRVSDQHTRNVGPIPGRTALSGNNGYYPFGFMNGTYRGFERITKVEDYRYAPGGWRLDPWDPEGSVARDQFWVHGGTGASKYPKRTQGCIRLRTSDIWALKRIWQKWDNKKNPESCYVRVMY